MRLFAEFCEKLYNTAFLMCRNAADAEDLVMRTIELAVRHVAQYNPAKPLFPWLCGILTNRYRMDLRGKARMRLRRSRGRDVHCRMHKGRLRFDADVAADPECATFLYEIVRR